MAEGRVIAHVEEAIVLRTWAFHEADLLISLFTREQGRVKGVARHAMRSRKRFGGALEPATQVRAHYTEKPRQDLVRMDSFEILWSPLNAPVDLLRAAGMQFVVEVLEEAMPEQAPEDNVFRLSLAVLKAMECSRDGTGAQVWLPVTYFSLWMNRLMGWWPELRHCSVCGLDLRRGAVWWSPAGDGVTCEDDRRPGSRVLSAESVQESTAMARTPLPQMLTEAEWPRERAADLRSFATGMLERHLERRLRAAALLR